ncbi:Mu-like prophage major head subunit gpT [Azorhizobium caulinodans ORS 571]|uniref:Mu-like prophage major head subunit gpT n=1 Tax=Azorhizobium caulinodans (strain ATCC 43989 / DSM 5975 / JCM 20966 / LMG 6465 / NBRC 14845 / NCIMB 13405 / ORS 571) TaxID=438753 RepID=A8I7Q6_AZOC5|nr:Mu-like prophage major head subunit gpT family protein [Azorhizobium caulinodans]BAF88147.1 Mu-like prophage major head subunit gpT [Azorhizobium caulinodans ORS 571]
MPRVLTPPLLEAINKGFKTNFQKGFSGVTALYWNLCTIVPSTSSEETYGWLGDIPKMREWIGDRHVHGLRAHGYAIRNRKFELTVSVQRDDIEDDRLGIYAPRFELLGQAAAEHPDDLVFGELIPQAWTRACYDGQPFFDTDHPVGLPGAQATVSNMQAGTGEPWMLLDLSRPLKPFIFQKRRDYNFVAKEDAKTSDRVFERDEYVYGSDARVGAGYGFWQMAFGSRAELTAANLRAAWNAITAFRSDNGTPLGVTPTHLVVGNTNFFTAKDILERDVIDGSTNTNRNLVTLLRAPKLAA